jgi:type IV secretory pathway VirJ component
MSLAVLPAALGLAFGSCASVAPPLSPPLSLHALPPISGRRLGVDTLSFGRFGPVVVYRKREHPPRVALFVSGDGGWNHGVLRMAEDLASSDALVVGIDIRRYLGALRRAKQNCAYPAGDFEALSQWVQHRLGFPGYVPPVLVGYSSGATLVYAALVQAPPGTFEGALSLGFCPDLAGMGSLCKGSGLVARTASRGVILSAAENLPAPWIVLQGESDSTCSITQAAEFVGRVRGAEIVRLPKVGHGFAVGSRWSRELRQAFTRLTAAQSRSKPQAPPAVRDLPLVELPSRRPSSLLAVVISGDGGWASLDRQVGERLAQHGIPVVGVNSLQYFWRARTPDQAGADLTRILQHYLTSWNATQVMLVGYSRGADVLPFMVNRLPSDLRERVRLVALLGIGKTAGFEFHFADLVGGGGAGEQPTGPELARLRGLPVICFYGTDESDSGCRGLPVDLATTVAMKGGHHFGGAYKQMADRILEAARGPAQQQRDAPSR